MSLHVLICVVFDSRSWKVLSGDPHTVCFAAITYSGKATGREWTPTLGLVPLSVPAEMEQIERAVRVDVLLIIPDLHRKFWLLRATRTTIKSRGTIGLCMKRAVIVSLSGSSAPLLGMAGVAARLGQTPDAHWMHDKRMS